MTNTKMTNRVALTIAIEAIGESNPEAVAKLEKMIEQLDKKNASPKKMTAQQEKNEVLRAIIVDFLGAHADESFTVSDLLKAIPELEGDSNQHVSALMRAIVLAGNAEKFSEKRKTYFRAIA